MKPRVFAPQVPSELDHATRIWVPKVNLKPAEQWGTVVTLLPPQAQRLGTDRVHQMLRDKLRDITRDDWIVCIGDPSFIAICSCIQYAFTDRLRLLKWERQESKYLPIELEP